MKFKKEKKERSNQIVFIAENVLLKDPLKRISEDPFGAPFPSDNNASWSSLV